MNESALIEMAREMVFEGKEYTEIKNQLQNYNGNAKPEAVKNAIRKIDDFMITYELAMQEKANVLNKMIVGIVLIVVGLGITAYTYAKFEAQFLLVYGLILVGAWIFKENYKKYQKPIIDFVPRKAKFKRRADYKEIGR